MDKYIIRAGIVIGLGIMGLVEGILFFQIFQWHHLICYTEYCKVNTVAELEKQVFSDGLFQLAMWIITLIGANMMFRAVTGFNISTEIRHRLFWGSLLIGCGLFNFLEGLISHQILRIHHILPGPHELLGDMVYLGSGIVLPIIGYFLIRRKREF